MQAGVAAVLPNPNWSRSVPVGGRNGAPGRDARNL